MHKKASYIALVLAVVALAVVTLRPANNAGEFAKKETAFERVMRTRTIRCAYAVKPPYLSVDPNTKQKSGMSYEIMEAIGKVANIKIDWQEEIGYGVISEHLNSGKQDAFCSVLWSSSARAQRLELTSPMSYAPLYIYVREGDTRFDNNLAAINSEETTIALIEGSSQRAIADASFPRAKVVSLPEMSDGAQVFATVALKKADAVFSDSSSVYVFNEHNPEQKLVRVSGVSPVRVYSDSFGVAKGEWELRDLLNASLEELQGDGTIERIRSKYEVEPNSIMRVAKPYATSANQ